MDQQIDCSLKLSSKIARQRRACFPVEFLSLRIIMSFRKLIPPFTLTGILGLKSNQDLGKPLTLERFLECLNLV